MSFRDSNRFEYIKQPHIIVLIVVIFLIVVGALFTATKRILDGRRRSNLDTVQACNELVKDENLCKFAASSQSSEERSYVVTSTTTSDTASEVTTLEVENPVRMKSVVLDGLKEIESFVIIDATTYFKDYSDDIWAMYIDPEYQPTTEKITYDFTNENSEHVIEFRDKYKFESKEPCEDKTCFKYKITDSENPENITYIWFDDQEYLMRRDLTIAGETTTNTQFAYRPVSIQAPTPTKEISQEDLQSYQ